MEEMIYFVIINLYVVPLKCTGADADHVRKTYNAMSKRIRNRQW